MSVLDASSIIHGWDEYPIQKFPKLWDWLDERGLFGDLFIASVALDEVEIMSPDCAVWIKGSAIGKLEVNSFTIQKAMIFKSAIGVTDDNYHAKA